MLTVGKFAKCNLPGRIKYKATQSMLSFTSSQQYYLGIGCVDMRKGCDGLSGLVRQGLGRNPLIGEVYIFLNRRRTHLKLLVWDRSGFVVYYKRLERGTFELPKQPGQP